MSFPPLLHDIVQARQRDLRAAADGHRLAEAVRPVRPLPFERLHLAVALARLARGARRDRRAVARPSAAMTAPEGPRPGACPSPSRC